MFESLEVRAHLSAVAPNNTKTFELVGPLPPIHMAVKSAFAQNASVYGPMPLSDPTPYYGTLDELNISTDTGEKPQSKVWKHDGSWFGVFAGGDGTSVYRLDGPTWNPILELSDSSSARADVAMSGNVAHVLLYSGTSSNLASIEYVPGAPGSYQMWSQRPTLTPVSLDSGVETATLDIDGNGRLWIASTGTSNVLARYSDSPHDSISAPITIATGIKDDDISAVTAMADGSIGVFWSNQNTERFGFRTHDPDDPASTWSIPEVPAAQSAENKGNGMADDHMNLAVASDGTLFAAVKTSYDNSSYPEIALLVRHPNGTWDDLIEIDNGGTRPAVVLNDREDSLMVCYTTNDSGGNIVYRKASRSNMAFGAVTTLLTGSLNNVTSCKQSVDGDVVFVAADNSENLHGIRIRQGVWGDTDLDLDVDLADLGNLATSYGISGGGWWSQGDFDNDGDVDLNDLGTLATWYGTSFV